MGKRKIQIGDIFKDSRYAIVSSIYLVAHSLEQAKLRHLNTSECDWQYAHGTKSFLHTRQGIFLVSAMFTSIKKRTAQIAQFSKFNY